MTDRDTLAVLIYAKWRSMKWSRGPEFPPVAGTLADAILARHAVVELPDEASENTWTNDVTGHVYVTVRGRMVVLPGEEWLTPDEVRHYAAALLAAARKAEEQS